MIVEQNPLTNFDEFNKDAFELTFKTFFPGLCSFAYKYVHDFDMSKSIVHDVFVNMWEKRATIDRSKSVKSYLFTSVRNRCFNYLRDQKKFDSSEIKLDEVSDNSDQTGSDEMEAAELAATIQKALSQLPEKCREVFKLNRFEGLKYKEIADQLHISVKTVEAQMTKALKLLRTSLKDYLPLILLYISMMKGLF